MDEERMVSRQRLYQIQQRELGNCIICGNPALPKKNKNNKYSTMPFCEIHRLQNLEHQAKRREINNTYEYKKPYRIPFIRVK